MIMHALIEQILHNCKRYGEKAAYQSLSGTITYQQLATSARRLAAKLDLVVPERSPVLVYGHKQPLMPVCFLACALSGRAYVPADDIIPPERVQCMAKQAGVTLALAVSPLTLTGVSMLCCDEIMQVCYGTDWCVDTPVLGLQPQELFYILFTSGSTGEPKGVRISYANAAAFTGQLCGIPGLWGGAGRVVLNQAAFSFDLSVADLYGALCTGATLFVLERHVMQDIELLFERLATSGAHTAVMTPSFAELCLCDSAFGSALLPELRAILFCGEPLRPDTVRRLFERFGTLRVFNAYGPTETTVAVTVCEITPALAQQELLPVGSEIGGAAIYVVDDTCRLLPDGEKGQLLVTGSCVGAGYTGTNQGGFFEFLGQRAYLTGDYGYRYNKLLYVTGRADRQIKHRGYRIELQDIEQNILRLTGVRTCAVIKVDGVREYLCAFICPAQGADITPQSVRSDLRGQLPAYMVPERVRIVQALPLTVNGKCDRLTLLQTEMGEVSISKEDNRIG